jgi:hypothetical protein
LCLVLAGKASLEIETKCGLWQMAAHFAGHGLAQRVVLNVDTALDRYISNILNHGYLYKYIYCDACRCAMTGKNAKGKKCPGNYVQLV